MDSIGEIVESLALYSAGNASPVERLCRSFGKVNARRAIAAFALAEQSGLTPLAVLEHAAVMAIDRAPLAAWAPELSYASELARRGAVGGPGAGAQLVLALVGAGLTGEFVFDFPFNERLMLAQWRFKCLGKTTIMVDAWSVSIVSGDEVYNFERVGRIWHLNNEPSRFVQASTVGRAIYVSGYNVDPEVLIFEDVALEAGNFQRGCADLDEAHRIVRLAGPEAFDWIQRLITTVSMVESHGGARLSSRSVSARSGNIEMAVPGDQLHIAELLVHEAAHQHFQLANLLDPLMLPVGADQLFLSALNGRQRPILRVLLAYHAVANIFLFLDSLAEASRLWTERAIWRLRQLGPTSAHLIATLGEHRDLLTANGDAFFLKMAEISQVIALKYQLPSERDESVVVPGVG
ncbi:hypothetical protein BH10PSE14_BH10PSE14_22190 [soil metagenome]